jgi:hypothetical protein
MKKQNLIERCASIGKLILQESILRRETLSGEIPFFVVPYLPQDEMQLPSALRALFQTLESKGLSYLHIDLFDFALEILEQEVGLETIFEFEQSADKAELATALQSSLDLKDRFVPELCKKISLKPETEYLFLSGAGKLYPVLRTHTILNHLQSPLPEKIVTFIFFPGKYDGRSFSLFGILQNDNYYRAFNIENFIIKN